MGNRESASLKTDAANVPIPKDRAEANEFIEYIGEARRELTRIETEMNDKLAELRAEYEGYAREFAISLERNLRGLQMWCEVHRAELLKGDAKTVHFAAGDVSWRNMPSKVTLSGVEKILAQLHELGLDRFIRTKEEVDKEAILREPEYIENVKGIKVGSAGEKFIVKPFETQLEEVA